MDDSMPVAARRRRPGDLESSSPTTPVTRSVYWIGVYLILVLSPIGVLLVAAPPPGATFWWSMAVGLGYAGLVMMVMQFVLTARFKRASAPFGIDLIYYFHRYLAYVLLAFLVAHLVILIAENRTSLGWLNPLTAHWGVNAGTLSLGLLLIVVVISAWRRPLGIRYERWRVAHLMLSVCAVGLGITHMVAVGYHSSSTQVRAIWLVIGVSLLAVVLKVRVARPWRLARNPFRVTEVRPEAGSAWTLVVEPDGGGGFDFEPGQFAWVTFRASPFAMREHPFSIASAPEPGGRFEFLIKERGDFTSTIGSIIPGERCYVDGPYGAFSIDRRPDAVGYVFIAGGIGIAPILSMLRALADRGDTRGHLLFAGHAEWDRIPCRDELLDLERRLNLRVVFVLEKAPDNWQGEVGLVTKGLCDRYLPSNRDALEYFVCGPVPMIHGVERALRELGVSRSRVHTELFDLV